MFLTTWHSQETFSKTAHYGPLAIADTRSARYKPTWANIVAEKKRVLDFLANLMMIFRLNSSVPTRTWRGGNVQIWFYQKQKKTRPLPS